VDREGYVKFMVSYTGLTWYSTVRLVDLQSVVRTLAITYQSLKVFTRQDSLIRGILEPEVY
jgi:hypothetical protein